MGRRLYYITVISTIVGVVLSSVFFWLFYQVETKNIEREFQDEVNDKALSYYKGLQFHLEGVYALKSHFDNNEILTASAFANNSAFILSRHNKVKALEWIPKVAHQERSAYEQQGKRNYPQFSITERLASGIMVPASIREYYYPVYYLEPLEGNRAALGYDMSSNAQRREVMYRAIESGNMEISEGVKLVQSENNDIGVLALLPVYQDLAQPKNELNLKGFILGVFDLSSIFSSIYRGGENTELALNLWDTTIPAKRTLLFARQIEGEAQQSLLPQYRYTRSVMDLGGRRWVLEATPSELYFSERRTQTPFWVFVAGNLFFGLSSWLAFVAAKKNQQTQNALDEKNIQLNEANEKLERLTKTDALTGIANRRYFDEYFQQEFLRAKREKKPLALLVLDIDAFKAFNDTYGHQAGDRCLRLVATELERILKRPADHIARIGGEEFAILLPNTNNGEVVARQCKVAIERLAIEHKSAEHAKIVTISVGVVSGCKLENHTPDTLFNLADSALYQAKSAGRNTVRAISVLPNPKPELMTLC
ncbi:hypothetical protein A3K86_14490 [Photobacterium jeanii]|uniref:diguanylate cyclase n=1 Tax=Photobacterium jeanii TaxID=858640 RepID=A0A178K9M5_9GAMM|nr:sensor domain-containing diguanylate cyclase [Photobacterium jeanii]OAN13766.1 hypothetical protein A3K86_14490 [Photobacterium jeanii]PST88887.1 sensor domain-containing diguanylate cyclase [Photobacterium jeanii]